MKDFEHYFESLGIDHDAHYAALAAQRSLYRRVLGNAWFDLPTSVRRMHGDAATKKWRGRARVARGKNLLAKMIGALFRFPRANDDVAVTVEFQRANGQETWIRNFDGRCFRSVQWEGKGAYEGLLCERFGPFTFGLALIPEKNRLRVHVRRWSMLGIPLPLWLGPRSNTHERDDDGRFNFHVDVGLPLIGPVVRYEGFFDEEIPDAEAVESFAQPIAADR